MTSFWKENVEIASGDDVDRKKKKNLLPQIKLLLSTTNILIDRQ